MTGGAAGIDGAAHVYLAHFRVRYHQLDPLGHVNNATYLNFLEQAAIDHTAAAGYDVERLREIGGVFIARRHEVDFLRPAYAGDWLQVATWAVEVYGARALRSYEVSRLPARGLAAGWPCDSLTVGSARAQGEGELIVRAKTEWAFVDLERRRPRRVPAELVAAFLPGDPLS